MQITIIISIILTIWLLGLSDLLFTIYTRFGSLNKGVEDELLKKGLGEVNKRLSYLEKDGLSHIQKVGLVRFNPFKELGGDHSFCLAMLDNKENGILLTCLHTRDRTRIYMKSIVSGKSEHDLSTEEKNALKQANAKK